MAENSAISWTDDTFNPWIGCTRVSPACDGCYAEALMGEGGRFARAKWGAPGKGEGTRVRTSEANWKKPLRWNREQAKLLADFEAAYDGYTVVNRPLPRFVFCASLADVFDNAVPPEWRRDLFDLIRATPYLTWLLLTKRPGNIERLFREAYGAGFAASADVWPRNAAIGCTVVNQDEADRDVPKLLAAKAALKPAFAFVSMEPLLGLVDLRPWLPDCYECASEWCGCRLACRPAVERCEECGEECGPETRPTFSEGCPKCGAALEAVCPDCNGHMVYQHPDTPCLDWIITGGETDQGAHKARPADPDWFRSLRDQCAAAGVPFHFKQWGEWLGVEELRRLPGGNGPGFGAFDHLPHDLATDCVRVGKDRAPCTLDGVRHDARPEVRA